MVQEEVGITAAATELSVPVVHAWVLVLVWTAVHCQEVLLLEVHWEPAQEDLYVEDTEEVLVVDNHEAAVELVV